MQQLIWIFVLTVFRIKCLWQCWCLLWISSRSQLSLACIEVKWDELSDFCVHNQRSHEYNFGFYLLVFWTSCVAYRGNTVHYIDLLLFMPWISSAIWSKIFDLRAHKSLTLFRVHFQHSYWLEQRVVSAPAKISCFDSQWLLRENLLTAKAWTWLANRACAINKFFLFLTTDIDWFFLDCCMDSGLLFQ